MGAQGTTTINFGATTQMDASVVVTGQSGITTANLVEAWINPVATADHSVDEHIMISKFMSITAHTIVDSTGFTISAVFDPGMAAPKECGLTGQFTVNWVWN